MKYTIQYEHLEDELVNDADSKWHFDEVKNYANKYSLELSDVDFKRFLKLQKSNKDIAWMMHIMSVYKQSFTDTLISYITY
ncbi:hypothetical protein [Lysinibacillus sp. BPa_S21]|uniref:hypothetical protein n=1 Tax=Lysinibacillus sp. BPa_S21 TaxID=2932478 RepID=UPI002011AE0E|nr:hypothetical protein [Lysinibacillus sp. BPa_S21]MCL1696334.1 hypothetical protein [Lysinibacillus sp. BPa_S21]